MSDAERSTLAEIAKRLGRKALQDIPRVAKPDTLLAWYRQLVAHKFDGSGRSRYPGLPRISTEVERLVVRMARENRGWGYDRIGGQHGAPAQYRTTAGAESQYIGTQCNCGPYSRESDYFGTRATAEAALPTYLETSRSPESARMPELKVDPRFEVIKPGITARCGSSARSAWRPGPNRTPPDTQED